MRYYDTIATPQEVAAQNLSSASRRKPDIIQRIKRFGFMLVTATNTRLV
jgi:hypothetical protein